VPLHTDLLCVRRHVAPDPALVVFLRDVMQL
jgi:hypothetical protein